MNGGEKQTGAVPGRKAALRAGMALLLFGGLAVLLISGDPAQTYPWIKALHVIAVISWMAGLFYLPRLFIYHLDAEPGSVQSETFKVMERRLFQVIMNPAMILSWILGLDIAWQIFGFEGIWLQLKLLAVMLLTVTHIYFGVAVSRFGRDERMGTPRFWRLVNEIPTILMIVIVLLVVVKPF